MYKAQFIVYYEFAEEPFRSIRKTRAVVQKCNNTQSQPVKTKNEGTYNIREIKPE